MEDLAALLAAALKRFPGLQGVASGAIASDYQRLRVEAVSLRAQAKRQRRSCGSKSIPWWHRGARAAPGAFLGPTPDGLLPASLGSKGAVCSSSNSSRGRLVQQRA